MALFPGLAEALAAGGVGFSRGALAGEERGFQRVRQMEQDAARKAQQEQQADFRRQQLEQNRLRLDASARAKIQTDAGRTADAVLKILGDPARGPDLQRNPWLAKTLIREYQTARAVQNGTREPADWRPGVTWDEATGTLRPSPDANLWDDDEIDAFMSDGTLPGGPIPAPTPEDPNRTLSPPSIPNLPPSYSPSPETEIPLGPGMMGAPPADLREGADILAAARAQGVPGLFPMMAAGPAQAPAPAPPVRIETVAQEMERRRIEGTEQARKDRQAAAQERERERQAERERKAAEAAAKATAAEKKQAKGRYNTLLKSVPQWARLSPETQRPLFASLRTAAIEAGIDPRTVPTSATAKEKPAKPADPARARAAAEDDYRSVLRQVTSPGFLKLPVEVRGPMIAELQKTARAAGRDVPGKTLTSLARASMPAGSRPGTGKEWDPIDTRQWKQAEQILIATVRSTSGSTKPKFSEDERKRARRVLSNLTKKYGGDPSLLGEPDEAAAPTAKPGPPFPKNTPPPSGTTAPPAPPVTAPRGPATKTTLPKGEATPLSAAEIRTVRDWIDRGVWAQALESPELKDPVNRARAIKAWEKIQGRRYMGNR